MVGGRAAAAAAGPAAAPALVLPAHTNTCEIGVDCMVNLEQRLGRGSYGAVYEGSYYDDLVAVKMLDMNSPSNVGFGEDPVVAVRKRIAREVELQVRAETTGCLRRGW